MFDIDGEMNGIVMEVINNKKSIHRYFEDDIIERDVDINQFWTQWNTKYQGQYKKSLQEF